MAPAIVVQCTPFGDRTVVISVHEDAIVIAEFGVLGARREELGGGGS